MKWVVIIFFVVGAAGLYALVAAFVRIVIAQNLQERKQAGVSMISSVTYLGICALTIYVTLNYSFSDLVILLISSSFLLLNELLFWKIKSKLM